ncbi:MAG: sigma-70 family RNA polymerase sigma factor [Candidatus Eisenbacteria bacterium]|nr:sigma-70 family RNA polymerase sigma factor [Candidatus Eisenbacteria bacterium]
MTDEELMERVAHGDEHAFAELYVRYRDAVAAHLWRLCGDGELAADGLSETFVKVWRRARSFSAQRGTFRTWLLAIAANTIRTLWRRRGASWSSLDECHAADEGSTPDRWIETSSLRAVWPRLSPDHREALSLRYFTGFSYEEIATVQQVPPATVRTRVFYGLKKLRTLLEDDSC